MIVDRVVLFCVNILNVDLNRKIVNMNAEVFDKNFIVIDNINSNLSKKNPNFFNKVKVLVKVFKILNVLKNVEVSEKTDFKVKV